MEQTEKMVKKQKKEGIASIIAVILLYGAFKLLGFGCPIKLVTGISCAGCGMTRAWEAMFHFHIEEAFYYHPLFFLPIVFGTWWIFRNKLYPKVYKLGIITMAMLFLTVYVIRLINPANTVIEINIKNGLIYHIFNKLIGR